MSIKAIIFDVDGTLLNTYEDLAAAVNYALSSNGFAVHPAENYKIFTGNGTDVMIKRALPKESQNDQTIEKLRPFYFDYYNKHSGEMTRPYDDIPELLKTLKDSGYKLGVVSNKVDFMTRIVIKEYFGDIFDFVTGQRDGVPTKPNPDMVLECMKVLDVNPNECVFVGDTGVDAQTGKNAGVFTVGVLWGFRGRDELVENGADAIISTPKELLKYL